MQILDWYKKSTGKEYTAETDPGVKSVQRIFKRANLSSYLDMSLTMQLLQAARLQHHRHGCLVP